MVSKKVLVPLLEGFEEIEAVTIIDTLRRAEVDVLVASNQPGPVRGSHDIAVVADASFADVDAAALDAIVLPGGLPGATNLSDSPAVQSLVRELAAAGKYTCAICAAPMALASAGIHRGKKMTCYPGFESHLEGATTSEERVVIDGKMITSRGPGTALEFSLALVRELVGPEAAAAHGKRMLAAAR